MSTQESAAVVIPPYISIDPMLWFHMLESTFALATPKPITESTTKYNYVVAHLPPATATVVRDVIMKPDATDPYLELKTKIVERCGESRTLEIRKLLAGESLGDRKPTELLRLMKRRAESHSITDELLLELFTQQMPNSVQTVLASLDNITPDKAAEVADRIVELTPNVSAISEKSNITDAQTPPPMDMLIKELQALRQEVAQLRRSRSVSRDGRKHRSQSFNRNSTYCWYHNKFQEKAKKCLPPCSYSENSTREK